MDRTLKSAVNVTFDQIKTEDIMAEESERDKDLEPNCYIDLSKYEVLDSDPLKFDEEEASVNSESFEEQREFKTNGGVKLYITKLGKYEVLDNDLPKEKKEEISVRSESADEKRDFEMHEDFKPDCKIELGNGKYEVLDGELLKIKREENTLKNESFERYDCEMDDDVILVSDDELGNYEMLDCEQPNVDGVTISDTTASSDSNTVFCVLCQASCDAQASLVCNSCQTKCDEQDSLENTPQCLDEAVSGDVEEVNIETEPISGAGENEDSLFLTTIINGQKTYCCEICLQKTTNSLHMVMHMDTHVKFKKLECTQCSFCCSCKEDLIKHTYAHIVNSKIWQSTDGVTEREKAQLQATVIDGRNVYFCQKCPYKALKLTSMRNHLSSHKVKVYKCTECFHCYSKIADLKKHMMISHPLNNKAEREDLPFLTMKINGTTNYCCQICPYRTVNVGTIKTHYTNLEMGVSVDKEESEGCMIFTCKVCQYKTINGCLMKMHVSTHTLEMGESVDKEESEGLTTLSCKTCQYKTTRGYLMKRHVNTHTLEMGECVYKEESEGRTTLSCTICLYKTIKGYLMKRHVNTHTLEMGECVYKVESEGRTTLSCKICQYKTIKGFLMIKHVNAHTLEMGENVDKEEIEGRTTFTCKICHYKTIKGYFMKMHVNSHTLESGNIVDKEESEGRTTFSCKICQYKTTSGICMKMHIKKHNNRKTYCCQICHYKTINGFLMKRHVNNHTLELGENVEQEETEGGMKFSCKICQYKTTSGFRIKRHINKHNNRKTCPYKTTKGQSMKKHVKSHTLESRESQQTPPLDKEESDGGLKFSCKICEFKTIDGLLMKRHVNTHATSKVFKCAQCSFCCIKISYLKEHMLNHAVNKTKTEQRKYEVIERKDLRPMINQIDGRKIYGCRICPYKTVRCKIIERHLIAHVIQGGL